MMHVSWTTLQEQIFAKLRRPYRSEANMNEFGHANSKKVNHEMFLIKLYQNTNVKSVKSEISY
jgi:hypothetical protein